MEPLGLSGSSHKAAVVVAPEQTLDANQVVAEATRDTVPAPAPELAVVVAVALATTLAPLNSTMIAVALPHIMQGLSSRHSVGWLAYHILPHRDGGGTADRGQVGR